MLLGFILLGRALETSARLNATSDLRSIADLLPKQSRLVLDSEGSEEQNTNLDPFAETVQLQLSQVKPDDIIRVFPGTDSFFIYYFI